MNKPRVLLIDASLSSGVRMHNSVKGYYDLFSARSVSEAISVIKKDNPELILLDTDLSVSDNIRIVRILKAIDISLPVIILSSGVPVQDIVKLFKAGAYEYFDRLFDPEELWNSVNEAIQWYKNHPEICSGSLPLDMEGFIQQTIESNINNQTQLKQALQDFREKYIDLITRKNQHNLP